MKSDDKINEAYHKIISEEKLFMHVRKTKKELKNLIHQYDDAKKYKNEKVLNKLKKEIEKKKKEIASLEKG